MKPALTAPATAVTDAGTETLALLELSAMAAPEPEAGLLRVTTQLDVPLGLKVAGVHVKPLTTAEDGVTVMLPPLTEKGMLVPAESARATLVT